MTNGRCRAAIIALMVALAACREPALKKIIGPWHVDDVPAGQASPHLYWVKEDGTRVVVDRQVRSVVNGGCLLYETTRGAAASVVYGVVVGKNPLAVATSDAFRPWHITFDGLRRFDPPHTDEQGTLRIEMDYITSAAICQLAYIQPAFTESWASAPLTTAPVKTEHTSLAVHGADSVGNTTLSDEVRLRHADAVDELLRAGAEVNMPNEAGITPLMTTIAYERENTAVLRKLLDAGADVNAQNKGGSTALMMAAEYGRLEAAKLLLSRGADPSIRNNQGQNAASMTPDSATALHQLLTDALKR